MAVVSEPMQIYRVGCGRIGRRRSSWRSCSLRPALLVLARLLPAEGVGLALRLAAAAACVLLVPGGIFVRALGRPHTFGVAIAASFAWSLAALAGALALTFAVDGTIETTLWLLAGFSRRLPRSGRRFARRLPPSRASARRSRASPAAARSSPAPSGGRRTRSRATACSTSAECGSSTSFDLTSLSVVDEFRERRAASRLRVSRSGTRRWRRRAARRRRPGDAMRASAGDPDAARGRARLRGRRSALPLTTAAGSRPPRRRSG